jgi:hypothetical protein
MQGYITLALDRQKYFDMAVNLARSIRYFDPKRPISVLINDGIVVPDDVRDLFDQVIVMPATPDYMGCAYKLLVFDHAPYDETMFVDSDCLIARDDMDRHWRAASASYFCMTGDKATSGQWNRLDIAKAVAEFRLPYVVRMNSGVFYFRRNEQARAVFARMNELYAHHRDRISNTHQARAGQYADEPFFGMVMGQFQLEPINDPDGAGSWMATTWQAKDCAIDPARGVSSLKKPRRYLGHPALLTYSWAKLTPSIFHFISLQPKADYARACAFFADAATQGRTFDMDRAAGRTGAAA